MRETSILAYAEVLENLSERQLQVLKAIDKIEPTNNLMISKYLNLPINTITPRTNELNKKGLIKEFKKGICPITKRTTIFYERIRK
jgi:predicted transcriptional regulator